jgi:vacuolar-type H+-ATPase subunit C/Vma6
MAATEIALTARARGVATRLLTRGMLEELAGAADFATLVRRLAAAGAIPDMASAPADVFAAERAAAQMAASRWRTLDRWQLRRPGVLDVYTAHADRRSLRALLRGAVQGATRDARLAGLMPTPTLPLPVLIELAAQASAAAVVHRLRARRYPDAERLPALAGQGPADLLALEAALLDTFARRARRAAVGGDDVLRDFVREIVDVGNAIDALLVAGDPRDVDPVRLFVDGGRWLSREAFAAAADAGAHDAARTRLATALAHSPLAGVVSERTTGAARVERSFIERTLQRLTRIARTDPLGAAPLLRVLLLIDAQAHDVRMLAWGTALGAPPAARVRLLVTPR